ncbi:helix-turn-helix domain-containing protein [Acetoanaerobium noterae]|uniref:helix-turn-helix domain-containing protein n=1 Tax=Acetoanaerobium noterae TaxID=745369 RepID=UPI003221CB6C
MKGSDIKMNDLNILINEIISEDQEIREEIELLEFKYKLIDELINFRKSYKLSQAEFADMIKVDKQMISRFEKGKLEPKLSFISKILHGMNKEINIRDKI